MDLTILISNLTNPTLLFFALGIFAAWVKSDLEIPRSSSQFISLYLLFAIGFKGGQELAKNPFTAEIGFMLLFGIVVAAIIPIYTFFILKKKLSIADAGAVAAAYGSVSAVTFVAATSFLDSQAIDYGGHMVAVMALKEAPAIIIGVVLMMIYGDKSDAQGDLGHIVKHSFTNGSVLMILGSLVIGFVADQEMAENIKPFTNDIFQGFLAIFLLDMGMVTARRIQAFKNYGKFVTAFGVVVPIINGIIIAVLSGFITQNTGDRFLVAILSASASYIAVPAAMRLAAPKADPGLYIPMALGITFPFNITLGMPLFYWIISIT
jgi:hypothetical protein